MTYRAWVCESCSHGQKARLNVWNCPGCGKEICESCFDRYAHCKPCAAGKTDEELRQAANAKGHDFEAACSGCGAATDGFDQDEPLCIDCMVVKALKEGK